MSLIFSMEANRLSRPATPLLAVIMLAVLLGVASMVTGCGGDRPSPPKSVEDAQTYVVGTWTFAIPLTPELPDAQLWQRWVIRADGTADIYLAPPISDSWGKPKTITYRVITDKYSDTGGRYYAMQVDGERMTATINDGALIVQLSGKTVAVLTRGDRNPFSK